MGGGTINGPCLMWKFKYGFTFTTVASRHSTHETPHVWRRRSHWALGAISIDLQPRSKLIFNSKLPVCSLCFRAVTHTRSRTLMSNRTFTPQLLYAQNDDYGFQRFKANGQVTSLKRFS